MLNRSQRDTSRLQAQLDPLVKDLPSFDPAYFFHDWLAEHYAPIDLKQLMPLARASISDCRVSRRLRLHLDDLDDDARGSRTGKDAGERLVLLDILHGGHIFHRDLFIRADAPPEAAPTASKS